MRKRVKPCRNSTARILKEACQSFEAKFGIEAFLDVMAEIIQDRLGAHGLNIEFYDDGVDDDDRKPEEDGGNHRSVERYWASDR
jgi:hypothetical protein